MEVDYTKLSSEVLMQVRLDLYNYDIDHITFNTGISKGAIYAFRSGRTMWPRPKTLFRILSFLGYEVTIIKRNSKPVDLRIVK